MDNRYFDKVIEEMTPFIEEQGFSLFGDGAYKNEKKAFKVEYDNDKQMYVLNIADIDEDNNIGEFSQAGAWLFDDTQNAKDASFVGIDFVDILQKSMGIKTKSVRNAQVELPTADGDKYTISTFTKKVLDTYPQLKDTYKDYIAAYGNFLYLNFFGTYLIPLMANTVNEKTKKSAKKIIDLIEPAFVKGDNEASNAAIACIGAVCLKDSETADAVMNILNENTSLKNAVESFSGVLKSKKKLKSILVKF